MIPLWLYQVVNGDAIQTLYFQCYMERGTKKRSNMISESNWALQASRTVRP